MPTLLGGWWATYRASLGPWRTDRVPKGSCSPRDPQLRATSNFWVPNGRVRKGGIPESVALAGCGHPRCSSHSLCSGQKRNGLLCARNPCPGPKPAVPSAQAHVGSSIWIFFFCVVFFARPLDLCAQGVYNALMFTLWPLGEISGTRFFFSPSRLLLATTAAHPASTSIPLREMASTAPAAC